MKGECSVGKRVRTCCRVLISGTVTLKRPQDSDAVFVVPDSREGWVDSAQMVLDGYFFGNSIPKFDYSLIRPAGAPIKVGLYRRTFGACSMFVCLYRALEVSQLDLNH